MKNKEHINQEADRTLASLDGVQRAVANPFLFTRIKARLQREEKGFWNAAVSFVGRPVVAIAAVLLIILLNLAIILNQPTTVPSSQDEEQLFASEYDLSGTTIYDATVDQQ
jgi:hypothetical protein